MPQETQNKGALRRFFEFLDLPGNVVQNLLKGNVEGSLRNLGDIITGATGLRLIPGVNKHLELSRDESDRPDVGFIGEILTDPLTWVSLPANAAAKVGLQLGRSAVGATSRALTKQGLKAVAEHGATKILPRLLGPDALPKWTRRLGKHVAKATAKGIAPEVAQESGEAFLKQLAQRKAMRETAKAVKRGILPEFLRGVKEPLLEGGVKLGVPFGPGKTVALKGHDVLKEGLKYTLPGQAYKFLEPYLGKYVKAGISKVAPMWGTTEPARRIEQAARNYESASRAAWESRIVDAIGDIPPETRKQMTLAIGAAEPEKAIAAMKASIPDEALRKQVETGLEKWASITSDMADELGKEGLVHDRSKLRKWYAPAQFMGGGDEDALLKMLTEEGADTPKALSARSKYLEEKKFKDIADMVREAAEQGKEVELDLLKAGAQRAGAQSRMMANAQRIRRAGFQMGVAPEAGSSAAVQAAKQHEFEALAQGILPVRTVGKKGQIEYRGAEAARRRVVQQAAIEETSVAKGALAPAEYARGQQARQMGWLGKSLEKHVPKKWREMYAVSEAPDHVAVGFAAKGKPGSGAFGKAKALARLEPRGPGIFEVTELPTRHKARQAALAAAHRYAAEKGAKLQVAERFFAAKAPHLQKLTDKAYYDILKEGRLRIKPSPLVDLLEKSGPMRLFRSASTVGVGPFVNVSFATRNALTGIFQGATDPQIALASFSHIRPMLERLVSKVSGKAGISGNTADVYKMLREFGGDAASGIDKVKIGNYTGRQALELARKNSVIRQGYTTVEHLAGMMKSTKKAWPAWAADANEFIENSMRLNAFTSLIGKGVDPAAAAEAVSKAFVDYRYQSNADRVMRAIFPFSRFKVAQTPRTVEASLRMPALTQPLRAFMAGRSQTATPPWMSDAPAIPIGTSPEGKQRIIGRTGHPLEDLSTLGTGEGLARTVEQGTLGALNPMMRMPLEAIVGKSFYTGQPIEKAQSAPAAMPDIAVRALGGTVSERGTRKLGWKMDYAIRNMPVSRQLREISKLLDDRKPVWARSLDFIAGVKTYDIDKDMELKRWLRDYLVSKVKSGEIGSVERFFSLGDTDEELTALIKEYYRVNKKRGKVTSGPPASSQA